MCGIVGIVGGSTSLEIMERATDALRHRGPDANGIYVDTDRRVMFGHRRLSVIDLSVSSNQPMVSSDGRFVLTFNGEIYNYIELRNELRKLGHCFSTQGDAEVLLRAYIEWGKSAFSRLEGMFAFGIFDVEKKLVVLCRDRLGVKPLYYFSDENKAIGFASEIRSLQVFPSFKSDLSPKFVAEYLRFGYVKSPNTVYSNVRKVRPGTFLCVECNGEFEEHTYWSLDKCYEQEINRTQLNEASDELEELMALVFRQRLVADVPLGIFLSGGVDSTLLTAILAKREKINLRTFTVGFNESNHNEAYHAAETARYLGTEHKELYFSSDIAHNLMEEVSSIFDEPLADTSALPMILLSQFASKDVRVALSADGGDEMFWGYRRYIWSKNIEKTVGKLPSCVLIALRKSLEYIGTERLSSVYKRGSQTSVFRHFWPGKSIGLPKEKLEKLLDILRATGPLERFTELNTLWPRQEVELLLEIDSVYQKPTWSVNSPIIRDTGIKHLAAYDARYYLPDDILMKVDRATMASSLEARDPFLDHRLIEFSARLPAEFKIKEGKGKFILKHILERYVPRKMIDRPKRGFSIPLAEWFASDFKILVRQYLSDESLDDCKLFNVDRARLTINAYNKGDLSMVPRLYALLNFVMWHRRWQSFT